MILHSQLHPAAYQMMDGVHKLSIQTNVKQWAKTIVFFDVESVFESMHTFVPYIQ